MLKMINLWVLEKHGIRQVLLADALVFLITLKSAHPQKSYAFSSCEAKLT
jgi:hypothetical protein